MALKSVEYQNVEFKSSWRDEYLKVISAFANTDGGKLMIGIDDKGKEKGSIDDIDIETVLRFKEIAIKRLPFVKEEKDNIKLLQKLNLVENGKLKRAAILLFGKNPKRFYTSSFIKIGKFLTDTDIVASDDVEGNLFKQVEKAIELLRTKYLISEIRFEGIYRKEELEYPEEALREAIINAVIHRDYIGAHTQLKSYPDKLILWNEGPLPKDIKIADLKRSHPSRPRNELLADIFFKAGLIETWGRGTIKITNECKKARLPEPEFKEEFGGFSVCFYKDIYSEEKLRKMGLNERQIKAVVYVKEKGRITNKEYQEITGVSKPTASRELAMLVSRRVLEQQGITGKGTFYTLIKGSQTAQMMIKPGREYFY